MRGVRAGSFDVGLDLRLLLPVGWWGWCEHVAADASAGSAREYALAVGPIWLGSEAISDGHGRVAPEHVVACGLVGADLSVQWFVGRQGCVNSLVCS